MDYESYLIEINSLIEYVNELKEEGWIGQLDDIAKSYQNLTNRIRYNWYFCEGIMYSDIDGSVKGNAMEFNALLHKLKTLQGRISLAKKYSTIHVNVEFDNLENILLKEIEKAENSIDIAVAWITNTKICNALNIASKKGIYIRIIMNDDEINKKMLKLENEIRVYKAPSRGSFANIMHNKFSIFDRNTVITGSYNWTNKAEYNNENIVIILNEEIAKKFGDEFNKLIISINQEGNFLPF
ncbi:DUF1669 domain-containing protein [Clostridium algidicarnis]|uniref:phospholipase D-like domain-containing protein n=1 Tax=Clostridium algidicarnis TaxID=37659 RepID=UPI001C0E34DE|nr:phospholipase D-like domain-containing protein [Clostridium algidicarnis]MBU3207121.1 DUF1669 domain-containing protein [Clostridium algidicarnis]